MNAKSPNEETLLEQALTFASAEARLAYLQGACGGDEALRARVQALIHAHEAAGGFLADPGTAAGPTIPMEPQLDERPGTVIGRYKLLQKIGEGGCGVVYMAEQEQPVRRRVALKVIKLGMDTKSVIARFEAERQALALMDHPNIAKVLDAGATDAGRPYFVMELVRGIRITEYCDQNNLSTKARLGLFIQVCHAIQHAHQKGIIHRDIKPSNILVSMHDGVPVPVVIDFGIAKATEQRLTEKTLFTAFEHFIGTPAYTSPEQAEMSRLDIDTRSDIYSLGVLLYELLTGKTPFDAKELIDAGLEEMRRTIREKEPARPSTRLSTMLAGELTTAAKHRQAEGPKLINLLRGDLDWIVMKTLEKDRTRRYETANGLAQDIERHLNNEPVAARPPSTAYKLQKFARRNKVAFVAGAAVAAALVIGIGSSTWQAVRAGREAGRARRAEALAQQRMTESDTVAKFMTEVFQSPDPERDGRTITVAETLSAAAKKLETDLASQPALKARLESTLGSTYVSLGLCAEGVRLHEKVRDYYRATAGPGHPDTLEAMERLAKSYNAAGRREELDVRAEMLPLQQALLVARRRTLGSEHRDTIQAMDDLALLYVANGRRQDAPKLAEEVLALRRKVDGLENRHTIEAMERLGAFYGFAGRSQDALKLAEEVLALRRKVDGPEHPDTLGSIRSLASRYFFSAGQRAEALKLAEEAVTLSRKAMGSEHPRTVESMGFLAEVYSAAGRREDALRLQQEMLALYRKVYGPEHHRTLAFMSHLQDSYAAVGRGEESLKLSQEYLPLTRKRYGPVHVFTLRAIQSLARSYTAVGRREEALKLLDEALGLCPKVYGSGTLDRARTMNGLAFAYIGVGRRDKADPLWEESLAICREVFGTEHTNTIAAMSTLARSYYDGGRQAEAVKLGEEVLNLSRRAAGPEHPETLRAMENLIFVYDAVGRREEALKLTEEFLDLRRKVLGPEHPYTLWTMISVAARYRDAGQLERAITMEQSGLELFRKVSGPEHENTLNAMTELAISYQAAKQLDEAIVLEEQALKLKRRHLPVGHAYTLESMENLATCYEKSGRTAEAAGLRKELVALKANGIKPTDTPAQVQP